eukprot:CAMPEP_0197458614 /NCGR_PEP_ID=MMETSP1175-20131217/49172_1 /TAXON_ID=1003142 /ORGANISM="Triceratium dubium, Strain CCMP147" /LENGTH=371 /DNA_ID=CAMNT_0042993293 /DNA_START=62 /DNA_END=1177 /DNA_ORIENTATION=-
MKLTTTIAISTAAAFLSADYVKGQQEAEALPPLRSDGNGSNVVNDGVVTFTGYINWHIYTKTLPYTISPYIDTPCELSYILDALEHWYELYVAWTNATWSIGYDRYNQGFAIPCAGSARIGSYYPQDGPNGEAGVVQTIQYEIQYDTYDSNFTGPFIDFDALAAEVFANNSSLFLLHLCDDANSGCWNPQGCPHPLFPNATAALYVGAEEPDCPSSSPSATPTSIPTSRPTLSMPPSNAPSASPSVTPTYSPSASPSAEPSSSPTSHPTVSMPPSNAPSASPSATPTASPSASPSSEPSLRPSSHPTVPMPPTNAPSASPSAKPTASPSESPSMMPSSSPTQAPSSGVARADSATAFAIGTIVAGLAASFL